MHIAPHSMEYLYAAFDTASPLPAGMSNREYQADDAARLLVALRQGKHPIYVLPTGAGKTAVIRRVILALLADRLRILFLVHRWELLSQASQTMHAMGLDHGLIFPGRHLCRNQLYVASVDTLVARLREYHHFLAGIDVIIVDEAHHAPAKTWTKLLEAAPRALRVGMTATPFIPGLGKLFNVAVEGPTEAELVAGGHLAPLHVRSLPLNLRLNDVRMRGGDYLPEDLERVMNNPEVTLPAVHHYAANASGRPCLVYCVTVRHAKEVAEQYRIAGYRATWIEGDMGDGARDWRLKGLENGEVQVLTTADLISEGTDTRAAEIGIMLRPTRSTRLFDQQKGRLRRLFRGKTHGLLLDLVGNTVAHGLSDHGRPWLLHGHRPGMERNVPPVMVCPSCACTVSDHGQTYCPACGLAVPPRPPRGSPDGEPLASRKMVTSAAKQAKKKRTLDELSDKEIESGRYGYILSLARDRKDLARIAAARGYKRGWVAMQAKARYF